MLHVLLVHSSVLLSSVLWFGYASISFASFLLLAVTNRAAVNICVQVFWVNLSLHFSEENDQRAMITAWVVFFFCFKEMAKLFHGDCTILNSC